MKKIKILYIVPSLRLCNGVASYAMNYFRNINHEKIQIDFITGLNEKSEHFDEIEKCGSKIYYIPKLTIKNFSKTIKQIKKFFYEHGKEYDIIHCHVLNMGAFYLYFAKKANIKVRILHSHATKYADEFINNIRNKVFAIFARKYANVYFACSKLAGNFMFKNKKFEVINNAVDIERYVFRQENREKIRNQEGINENDILLVNVARFVPQKNLLFLVDAFNKVISENSKFKLLLIGSGPLEEKVKQKIEQYNISDKVIMKSKITNVNEYMCASDLFVLPSLFEGLPVVGIEAQCSGLKCLFSDTITKEAKVTENVKFLSIEKEEDWAKEILNFKAYKRKDETEAMRNSGYQIETQAKKLEKLYEELLNWRNK